MRTTIDTAPRVPAQAWRPYDHPLIPSAGAHADNGSGIEGLWMSLGQRLRCGSLDLAPQCTHALVPSQTASAL